MKPLDLLRSVGCNDAGRALNCFNRLARCIMVQALAALTPVMDVKRRYNGDVR